MGKSNTTAPHPLRNYGKPIRLNFPGRRVRASSTRNEDCNNLRLRTDTVRCSLLKEVAKGAACVFGNASDNWTWTYRKCSSFKDLLSFRYLPRRLRGLRVSVLEAAQDFSVVMGCTRNAQLRNYAYNPYHADTLPLPAEAIGSRLSHRTRLRVTHTNSVPNSLAIIRR